MGNKKSCLANHKDSLAIYTDTTVFNAAQILKLYEIFLKIGEIEDSPEGIFPTFNEQTSNFDQNVSQTLKIPIEKFCERFYNYERSSRGNSQVKIVPGAKVDNLGLNSTSSVSKPNSALGCAKCQKNPKKRFQPPMKIVQNGT